MKVEISKGGVFSRHVCLEPIASLPGNYCLKFESRLTSARDPQTAQRNFEAILSRGDILALQDLLVAVGDEACDAVHETATK